MPRQCTTANPLIGPDPNAKRARPAISVVTFESKMVAQALSNPIEIADWGDAPLRNSSRIRSLINTFESMAIPRASAIAAIPGRVNVA